jgi:superfamily I DNA/RNA helicase
MATDDDYFTRDDSVKDIFLLHRVVGPPGCGKTTDLSRQIRRAAEKYGGPGVVVASLTRAAAAEVTGRQTPLPRQNIGTLHSHAYHALKRPAIVESKEGLQAWNEFAPSQSYKLDAGVRVDPENAQLEPTLPGNDAAKILNDMNILRQRKVPRELWPPKVIRFARKWDEFKQESGMWDFTDLIERAIEDIDCIPGDPKVVMLDEAQDMSKLEMDLAMKWGRAANHLVIVGDPDQNLYQWRGSDPEAFYSGLAQSERVLSQSWRVPGAVHARAVEWISRMQSWREVDYHPRKEDPRDAKSRYAPGECRTAKHTWADPRSLVSAVQDDLNRTVVEWQWHEGEWRQVERPATVMILTACNYMLKPITNELRDKGVLFHNPYRSSQGAWNPLRGTRRMLAFLRPSREVWGDEARLWTWGELKMWAEILQAKGVMTRGAKSVIEARGRDDVGRFGGESDEIVPLDKVMAMFVDEVRDHVFDQDVAWWVAHLRHSDRDSQNYARAVAQQHGPRKLREAPRLCVGTIHSVKGGEADFVYLFPDLSGQGYFNGWKRPGAQQDAVYRQFYVGMTRAKHELNLCAPSGAECVRW